MVSDGSLGHVRAFEGCAVERAGIIKKPTTTAR
jgi:hypothetical protein